VSRTGIAVALALAVSSGGCGLAASRSPAPRSAQAQAQRSAVAQAQATHEYRSPSGPPERVRGAMASQAAAVAVFAWAYINWNADTVSADMRALAARSIGQARSAVQLAAGQTAGDYELQRGGIANSGVVEAVAPLTGRADSYAVVTRELTTATATTAYQGLQPAWHVAIATVAQIAPGQWVVSGWQPQS
jgi:hypothetical protein